MALVPTYVSDYAERMPEFVAQFYTKLNAHLSL
jgi:hypothetical protein